jgi:hypothetical protein
LEACAKAVMKALTDHPAALPDPILTSARKISGIAELRTDLAALADAA